MTEHRSIAGIRSAVWGELSRVFGCRAVLAGIFCLLVLGGGFPRTAASRPEDDTEKDFKGFDQEMVRRENGRRCFERGKIFYEDGSYDLAREQLIQALQYDLGLLKARYYLGLVESAVGKHALAIEHFTAVYKKEPDLVEELPFEMARSYLELNDCDQAQKWLDRYLKKHPASEKASQLKQKIKDRLLKQEKKGG